MGGESEATPIQVKKYFDEQIEPVKKYLSASLIS